MVKLSTTRDHGYVWSWPGGTTHQTSSVTLLSFSLILIRGNPRASWWLSTNWKLNALEIGSLWLMEIPPFFLKVRNKNLYYRWVPLIHCAVTMLSDIVLQKKNSTVIFSSLEAKPYLCGKHEPKDAMFTVSSSLIVNFQSDASENDDGFELYITRFHLGNLQIKTILKCVGFCSLDLTILMVYCWCNSIP